MPSFEEALRAQQERAAARVAGANERRRERIELLGQPGGMARADDPERVATRIDRLSRYFADVRPVAPLAVAAEEPDAMAAAGAVLERIINTDDFLGVRYLEAGALAARAVGRINIRDQRGRLAGYGTGSLVSPELLLTNHHVLSDAGTAGPSSIEFDYQDGIDGQPLASRLFDFDPERFFLADEELDFALVAVRAGVGELARFGFNRLIEAEGKAIVGDFVTIIQHPGGEKKQVALRENRIVDLLEQVLHYETDTEPGSSGSPVFNDQLEVVALHHASVPAPGHDELGGIVNEGIRVSQLLKFIGRQRFSAEEQALVDRLFAGDEAARAGRVDTLRAPAASGGVGQQTERLTVPLEITVRAGEPSVAAGPAPVQEAITIDPDYAGRRGYDAEFLGAGRVVPLPTLAAELAEIAAINRQATGEPRYVLPYHHFSVVMNRERRLAFFTSVNIDGETSLRIKRENDRWFFDPRLGEDEQTGEQVYRNNPLDRGHLVRRLDPAWGPSREVAKSSNDDTFHFTNCTPQHERFNQNQTTWAGLEDYILENADNRDFRVSVFTGPVLAEDDQPFEGIKLPRQFWKVVAMVKQSGELSATAYLLSQEDLIRGLEIAAPEEFAYGAYKTYQVPVRRIEQLTELSFGALSAADPLDSELEAAVVPGELERLEQIRL